MSTLLNTEHHNTITVFQDLLTAEKLVEVLTSLKGNLLMKDVHELISLLEKGNLTPYLEETINYFFYNNNTIIQLPIKVSIAHIYQHQKSWNAYLKSLPEGHTLPKRFAKAIKLINHYIEEKTNLCQGVLSK